jgi:hypothetical protein
MAAAYEVQALAVTSLQAERDRLRAAVSKVSLFAHGLRDGGSQDRRMAHTILQLLEPALAEGGAK